MLVGRCESWGVLVGRYESWVWGVLVGRCESGGVLVGRCESWGVLLGRCLQGGVHFSFPIMPCCTLSHPGPRAWLRGPECAPMTHASGPACLPGCRGLRVRMGVHCGLDNPQDMSHSSVSQRVIYSGMYIHMPGA